MPYVQKISYDKQADYYHFRLSICLYFFRRQQTQINILLCPHTHTHNIHTYAYKYICIYIHIHLYNIIMEDRDKMGKISEKQFGKISLFRNVKQVNGDKIFKLLYEQCKFIDFGRKTTHDQLEFKKNFIYVYCGEIMVYKARGDSKLRSLIKSYKAEQYCGVQDYPLFWNEQIKVEATPRSIIMFCPLAHFYRFFRRAVPMTYLQSKAEYLKRLPLFRGVEIQKIFKLACLSHKYRMEKEQILVTQSSPVDFIVIICNGSLLLESERNLEQRICIQNEDLFVNQLRERIKQSPYTVRCVTEADILVIPREQFQKIVDIRYKLTQTVPKEKPQTLVDRPKSSTLNTKSFYLRAKTEGRSTEDNNNNNNKSRSYTRTGFSRVKQKMQTSVEERSDNAHSLGEIHLIKFIKRKQKIESRNFFRYIESRAPEIVINPSKQFSLVKPSYRSKSLYVKNLKRKLKHSALYSQSVSVGLEPSTFFC